MRRALYSMLAVILIHIGGGLAGASPQSGPKETAPGAEVGGSAEELFIAGARAFMAGDDARAADLLMAAARLDLRCLGVLWDPRYSKWLPPGSCAEAGAAAYDPRGDAGPCALYRLGTIRTNRDRDREGGLAARKAGRYYWSRTVEEFPDSVWAGKAALELIESGGCLTGAGYPDCQILKVRAYEDWLARFSGTEDRDRVVRLTAEGYLELADLLEGPGPWSSRTRAELCRGRALELAGLLNGRKSALDDALWARDFIRQVRESGRPWSVMPPAAVSAAARARQQQQSGPDYSFFETRMKTD